MIATTNAGIAIRAPTISPAPKVDDEIPQASIRLVQVTSETPAPPRPGTTRQKACVNKPTFKENPPAIKPPSVPPPSLAIDRLSKLLSVSARRIFATAYPDGYVSCIRSTSNGV